MRVLLKEPKKIVPLFIAALFFLTIYINSFPRAMKIVFYPFYRELMKSSFIEEDTYPNVEQSRSFKIYYKDSSSDYIQMILDTGEESLIKLREDFE
jgi:hypothetical protein